MSRTPENRGLSARPPSSGRANTCAMSTLPLRARPFYQNRSLRGRRAPEVDPRQTVHAEDLGYLAGVVRVMGDEPHEHGLSRMDLDPPTTLALECLVEHLRRPARDGSVNGV